MNSQHLSHVGCEQQPKKQQQQHLLRPRKSSGVGKGGGEIIAVEGGHIVRPITRKDRHSKVME